MIRIICPSCKNAYLESKEDSLICTSCQSTFAQETENLLLGIQYYNECDYDKANDCLMKFIVKNGAEPRAIFYKALCDGFCYDEDTLSISEVYAKLLEALQDLPKELFPEYIALANDEAEKLERAIAQSHIHLFVDADAEKIKKEVSTIINLQNEAKAFRVRLNALVNEYNEAAPAGVISAKFSECFLVDPDLAAQVGDMKFNKITENIASHTVFTGILSTEIKNLEIYYRCIVMFFKKNKDKYNFLSESSKKFTELSTLLEEGQYSTIKGTSAIGDKLRVASYDFFQESLKDNDEEFETQAQTVVILAPEPQEEPQKDEFEDVSSVEETAAVEDTEPADTQAEEPVAEADEVATEEAAAENAEIEEDTEATVVEVEVEVETEATEAEPVEATAPVDEETDEQAADESIVEIPVIEVTAEANTQEPVVEITEETTEEPVIEVVEVTEAATVEEAENTVSEATENEPSPAAPKKRKKSYAPFVVAFLLVAGIIAIICVAVIPGKINESKYAKAQAHMNNKEYRLAAEVYADLGEYEDAQSQLSLAKYSYAGQLEEQGKFDAAKKIYIELGNYEDSIARASSCTYNLANAALEAEKFDEAKAMFESVPDYADSKTQVLQCDYQKGISFIAAKEYAKAIDIFTALGDYSDSKDRILEAKYKYVKDHMSKDDETTVAYLKDLIEARYQDSVALRRDILGDGVIADGISTSISYSATDAAENLTEADRTKPIYFHIAVGDPQLYGKALTVKFTTSVGYTERKSVTFTKANNTYALMYPRTNVSNYTVEFSVVAADGSALASQKITIK